MHGITRLLANPGADILSDANNITHRAVRVLHTHVDDAAVIRLAVKGGMDFDSALAEFCPKIIWKCDIRAAIADVGSLDYRIKFVEPFVHS